MRNTRVTLFWLLQIFALVLTFMHMSHGVLTDEAKYLLSIPYPHPPFVREVMSWTSSFFAQEFLWRLIFSLLMVNSVWLLIDLGNVVSRGARFTLLLAWLLAAPILLQSGAILLVNIAVLFGMVMVWMVLAADDSFTFRPEAISLLWLIAIFSSMQSLLFLPLVWVALGRTNAKFSQKVFYLLLPLALLGLYALTNPILIARVIGHTSEGAVYDLGMRAKSFFWVWLLAGGALSIVGTWGIFRSERWELLLTLLLVSVYVMLSPQMHYAILFLPLLLGGLFLLLCHRRVPIGLFFSLHILSTLFLLFMVPPVLQSTLAKPTMEAVRSVYVKDPIIIDGPFGHEWQYESPVPIRKYSDMLSTQVENDASYIICTRQTCVDSIDREKWKRVPDAPLELWIPKTTTSEVE